MQPSSIQTPVVPSPSPKVRYAGFWRRFVAHLIDQCIIGIVGIILFVPVFVILGIGIGAGMAEESPSTVGFFLLLILAAAGVLVIIQWLYYALMESSSRQATLGKLVLGIIVTDMSWNRISFGRATGRYFGKIISGLILYIWYIMAGLTEKKQALHDIMASCLVILK